MTVIPHEHDEEIIALYQDGYTIKEIAQQLHWSNTYVRNRLVANNIPRYPKKGRGGRKIDQRRVKVAVALRMEHNKTVPEIAEIVGTSTSVIIRYLKLAGVYEPLRKTRTKCPHGHLLTPANTYEWRGGRQCKACKRRKTRESMAKLRKERREKIAA